MDEILAGMNDILAGMMVRLLRGPHRLTVSSEGVTLTVPATELRLDRAEMAAVDKVARDDRWEAAQLSADRVAGQYGRWGVDW